MTSHSKISPGGKPMIRDISYAQPYDWQSMLAFFVLITFRIWSQ